VVRRCV